MKHILVLTLAFFSLNSQLLPAKEIQPAHRGGYDTAGLPVVDRHLNFVKGYTYERVLIGDEWWIFVYDEDHRLVNTYPDSND